MLKRLRKKTKRAIMNLVSAMHDKPLSPPSSKEEQLVTELRGVFQGLQGGQAEDEWFDNARRLNELVANDDPREFLRWDVIRKTMFVAQAEYVKPELQYLQSRPDWSQRWSRIVRELPVGHPTPYWRYPQSSGNVIHHTYHWARYEEATGSPVRDADFIFEFGGGYGSMCRLAHAMGFHGRYVLFDLPAYSALQRFYLQMADMNVVAPDTFKRGQVGIVCVSDMESLTNILRTSVSGDNVVFVATWSLSESPVALRHTVLDLTQAFTRFLVAYQAKFADVDNARFFQQWCARRPDIEWRDTPIDSVPGNSRYLFGERRPANPHAAAQG